MQHIVLTCVAAGVFLAATAGLATAAAPVKKPVAPAPAATNVTAELDASIRGVLSEEKIAPAGRTRDEDFLRRVSLDLAGRIPTPQEVTLFSIDPDPAKRAKLIDRLLDSESYADIWAGYWGEVIYSRATDPRSRAVQGTFEAWMKAQLAANKSWSDITTELITATGGVQENGATALVFAHTGDPVEISAEASRIFLGIQIQCANCHDHPTDSWKREQFHELAAFFPRIQVRRDPSAGVLDFSVASADSLPRNGNRQFNPEDALRFLDRNRDGKLSKEEAKVARGPLGERFDYILELADKDKDGMLSVAELKEVRPPDNQPGRGAAEYRMPDLQDPSSPGTEMQPVFFVDGLKLDLGTTDLDRRGTLAEHITSKTNPWFSRAFVNRIWGEMLGDSFYMPIDDIGPERTARFPEVLDLLANEFAAHNYDIKWLFRTIANSEAYQRQVAVKADNDTTPGFAVATATRLRSDQVYNALTQVLGVAELGGGRRPAGMAMPGYGRFATPRRLFATVFGYDPSTPQEDIIGNVPQALLLMNSPYLAALIRADGDTTLGRIVRKYPDDRDAVNEVYLRVLSREPSAKELQITQDYIHSVGQRNEAYEDLMWSLLNSSEFLSKR